MNKNLVLGATLFFYSVSVHAGFWKEGQGETIRQALDDAATKAQIKVNKAGSGCVDRKVRNLKIVSKPGAAVKYYSIQIHGHDHNSNCSSKKVNHNWKTKKVRQLVNELNS